MHQAGDTFWWLVPSGDWPAYQHGKLAFSLAKDDARKALLGINDAVLEIDTIFAAFTVERGPCRTSITGSSQRMRHEQGARRDGRPATAGAGNRQ
jgi:hypothetical protein